MGWMQALSETYDKSRSLVGRLDEKECILLPIAHSRQNAQIEIVIGIHGDWKSAKRIEKADAVTMIPVTENSGSRANGIAPHPLFDKLCYVAGDYENYCSRKKAGEYFQAYIKQFEEWVQVGCHEYVKAVYSYVKKKQLIRDLTDNDILVLNENGELKEGVKIEGVVQTDVFVRFRIQDENVPGLGEIWKEQAVYGDYVNYYQSRSENCELDYVTGERLPCSVKHAYKIRNSADKAKLISANDNYGFTYRGRFVSREAAVSVGDVSSQKAHNALRWLIERQGYRKYGMCVVTWNPDNEDVPDYLKMDAGDCAYAGQEIMDQELGEDYAGRISQVIRGRYKSIDDPAKEIVVMALDAATPGRLSITYYRQMSGSVLLDNLLFWYTSCCWKMNYKKNNLRNKIMTPIPEEIVKAAYGVERKGFLEVEDRLMEASLKRLIPCMIEGKSIPRDMIKSAIENTCRPLAFGVMNRRMIMEVTCALIRKKSQDRSKNKKGEFDDMALDHSNRNRDYLYGRLLATAHKVEYDTFSEEESGKRNTNAERYRSMMVRNPKKIWPLIDEKIQPYMRKLNVGLQVRYQQVLQEIYDSFETDDFSKTGKLGERFLIGYHCQLSELWNWKSASGKK